MLDIKVLGPGCTNCKRLEALTRAVVTELGLQANIEKVEDFDAILKYPILATPALVINGRVVCSGRVPSRAEIAKWLTVTVSV
ncbi:MAG: thioredoxin family protein [Thermanaerothrix sp.]|jgi:small redox-active disulfide protein 2|uniref:Thioredoxin family protein n=1 Tax=Thermanaerothrix solaris TaxID=3058434 RepID=A0ABU3NPR1_9CHLR|nr:thioredoxin family protein [Thermanaerothrix sp. 4228-RoL]MDT8898828.1 thioredoxin family protein [Thermanaerothrix sp. 4228-RoL]